MADYRLKGTVNVKKILSEAGYVVHSSGRVFPKKISENYPWINGMLPMHVAVLDAFRLYFVDIKPDSLHLDDQSWFVVCEYRDKLKKALEARGVIR